VIGSQPPCNSTVFTQVTDFVVSIGAPVEPSSVQPSDFTVNGIPADDDGVAGTSITFHFNASPVVQGQNTMHIPAGAFTCQGSGLHLCVHLPAIHAYTNSASSVANRDRDSNSYTYFDTETFTDAEICANAPGSSHPAAASVVCCYERSI
jgi:hypothetical protein